MTSCGGGAGTKDRAGDAGAARDGPEEPSDRVNGVSRRAAEEDDAGSKLNEGESGNEVEAEDCAPALQAAKNTDKNKMAVCRIDDAPKNAFRAPTLHP